MGGGLCRKIPRYGQVPEDAPGWKKKIKTKPKKSKAKTKQNQPK